MWYDCCEMVSGSSVSSNQKPSGAGHGNFNVRLPRETHRVRCLEYVERKPWKYMTKRRYSGDIPTDYPINVESSKFPRSSDAADGSGSLVAVEVEVDDGCDCRVLARRVSVERCYTWDGPSGPTFDPCGSTRAGLVHDVLYQSMRLGYLTADSRMAADRSFRTTLEEGGMRPLHRWLWYVAVRWGGRRAVTPKPLKGRKYPGMVVLLLGATKSVYWLVSEWRAQVAEWLDSLKVILSDWGGDLDALCKGGFLHGGCAGSGGAGLLRCGTLERPLQFAREG